MSVWELMNTGWCKVRPAGTYKYDWKPDPLPEIDLPNVKILGFLGYANRRGGDNRATFFETDNPTRPIFRATYRIIR